MDKVQKPTTSAICGIHVSTSLVTRQFLKSVFFIVDVNNVSVDVSVGINVSFVAVSLRENI
jgi:hypothetical protein